MNTFFISIQATYSSASLSLFSNNICLETVSINDARASSYLIPYLERLLNKHQLSVSDISFIAVDRGPGAFTSLRVCIATVNGIAFSQRVPLLGVDGLEALGYEQFSQHQNNASLYISMLNAYNNDVYYALHSVHNQFLTTTDKGCKKIELFLEELNAQITASSLVFTGNGAYLHQDMILKVLGDRVQFAQPMLQTASSLSVGILAYAAYKDATKVVFKIEPSYMKTQYFAVRNVTQQ